MAMWGAAPRHRRILILLGMCAAIVFGCVHGATAASRQATGAIDDFNGDGRSDFAFFRPSTDLWSVRNVGNVTWGASGDIPVPGDYNGDGKTDYAFFRPSTGVWSVRNIANITWGVSGDIPAPGDYNGDGKTDTAVFRPSTGVWYANGTGSATWGASGDMPIRDGVAEAAARGTPTPPPTDTTPPSPVSGFNVAGVTQTTISVGWVPASDNVGVTGYNVYRDGVKVGSPTTTSFTVTGLTCGTSHSLAVEAVDAAGNFSNRALSTITQTTSPCASDTTAPSAPTNLHTTGSTATSITVSWNASTDNVGVSGYGRYLNGSLASSGTGTTYTFGSLTCATSYDLAVDAYDAATNRSAKATIAASTAACPAGGDTTAPSIPTNFRVTGTTSSSITVAWNASTDNVGVTSYGLYNGAVLTGSATSTSATFNGLPCNSSQTLAVDASDAAGNRSGKATLSAATSACPTDTTAPSTPTNLRVTGATSSSITVAWNASTDNVGVTSYGLYKAGTLTGSTTTTSATFNGLPCNTTQALAVDAADAAGNRSGNATLTASTSACPDTTPPSTPTGLATTGSSQATISLSWNASTDNVGVTGYNIYRAGSLAGTSTTTSFTAGSLSCATGYGFSVQAKDAAGNVSTNSSSVNATTAACSAASHPPGGGWLIRSADDGASTYTGSLMDDPIVFPGRPGASHMHDFFCNAQTTGSSTYLQMVAAPTACPSGDAAGYWAPALYKNGVKINPSGSGVRGQIYYRASNITANVRMTAFPADFMMIVGDSHATSLTDANAVNADSGLGSKIGSEQYWGCSDNSESGKSSEPINCSTGIISLHLGFPNCWNGVKVNGDQIKAGTMRFPSSGACPTDFPIVLPRLIERFEYPVGTDSSGITLSSGPTYTVHADFWNTWRQSSLEFLVDNCLNAAIDCGTNPSVP
jgi:chitodextrinase